MADLDLDLSDLTDEQRKQLARGGTVSDVTPDQHAALSDALQKTGLALPKEENLAPSLSDAWARNFGGAATVQTPARAPQVAAPPRLPTDQQARQQAAALGPASDAQRFAAAKALAPQAQGGPAQKPSLVMAPEPQAPTDPDAASQRFGPLPQSGAHAQRREIDTLDPQARAQLEQGKSEQFQGLAQGTEAETKQAQDVARQAELEQAAIEKQQRDGAAFLAEERRKYDKHVAELARQGEDLAKQKVDPNHYFASQSTGDRIRLGFALALGSAGASLTHSQNVVGNMIQQAISDDISAQKTNIENSKSGLENARGLLADKWRLYGEREKAVQAATQAQLQAASAHLDQIAKENASPQVQAAALKAKGQLNQQFALLDGQLKKSVTTGGMAVPNENKWVDEFNKTTQGRFTVDEARQKYREIYGGQTGGPTLNYAKGAAGGAGAEKEKQEDQAAQDALNDINALQELHNKHKLGTLSPNDRAQADSISSRLTERMVAALPRAPRGILDLMKHTIPQGADAVGFQGSALFGADPVGTKLSTLRGLIEQERGRRGKSGGEPTESVSHLQEPLEDEEK